jgi:hypothetical protein
VEPPPPPPELGVGVTTTGAAGVAELDAELGSLTPIVFVAVTVKVYGVPLVRPVTLHVVVVVLEHVCPAFEVAV